MMTRIECDTEYAALSVDVDTTAREIAWDTATLTQEIVWGDVGKPPKNVWLELPATLKWSDLKQHNREKFQRICEPTIWLAVEKHKADAAEAARL